MLMLSLLRHAKAEPERGGLQDRDRALAERGRADAARMGQAMAERGVRPDLVLCSTAVRTRQTYDLVRPYLAAAPKVEFEEALYLAESYDLADRIVRIGPPAQHVLIIGHNPGLHELAMDYVKGSKSPDVARLRPKFPTGAIAVILFDVARWSGVRLGKGQLDSFMAPSALRAGKAGGAGTTEPDE